MQAIDRIFDLCVELLVWLADKFGTTCKAINVWIFCAILPPVLLGQTAAIIWLLCRASFMTTSCREAT
jgi:hypothetical protein